MTLGKIFGFFLLFWLGAAVVLTGNAVMEATGGIGEISTTLAELDWAEIASRSFFYGALALGVYNIYYRRKQMQESSGQESKS